MQIRDMTYGDVVAARLEGKWVTDEIVPIGKDED